MIWKQNIAEQNNIVIQDPYVSSADTICRFPNGDVVWEEVAELGGGGGRRSLTATDNILCERTEILLFFSLFFST